MATWLYGTQCDPGLAGRLSESCQGVEYGSGTENISLGSLPFCLGTSFANWLCRAQHQSKDGGEAAKEGCTRWVTRREIQ
jgi:hypothetical protein